MKLKLFGFDFEESTITFEVPEKIMSFARWSVGESDVDLSEISDIENEPSVQADAEPYPECGVYARKYNYNYCPWCGRKLRTA